jgi:hypothetical protein
MKKDRERVIEETHNKIQQIERECTKLHGIDNQSGYIANYFHVQLVYVCPICKNKVNAVIEKFGEEVK